MSDVVKHYDAASLAAVDNEDLKLTQRKDVEYGASWLKRGGHSAAENIMRKIDRITVQLEKHGWDVFKALSDGNNAEGLLDTMRDLRGYLLLAEAEWQGRLDRVQASATSNGSKGGTPKERTIPRVVQENTERHVDRSGMSRPFGFQADEELDRP